MGERLPDLSIGKNSEDRGTEKIVFKSYLDIATQRSCDEDAKKEVLRKKKMQKEDAKKKSCDEDAPN